MGNFFKKIGHREVKKIAQSGHTAVTGGRSCQIWCLVRNILLFHLRSWFFKIPELFFLIFVFSILLTISKNCCCWPDSNHRSMFKERTLYQLCNNHCQMPKGRCACACSATQPNFKAILKRRRQSLLTFFNFSQIRL